MRERRDKWGNEREQSTRPVWAPQDDDTADVRDHPHGPHEGRGDNPTRIVSGGQGSADRPHRVHDGHRWGRRAYSAGTEAQSRRTHESTSGARDQTRGHHTGRARPGSNGTGRHTPGGRSHD